MTVFIKVIKRTSNDLAAADTSNNISKTAHRRLAANTAVIVNEWIDELRRNRSEELRILERQLGWGPLYKAGNGETPS
jgi:hypothetical protein